MRSKKIRLIVVRHGETPANLSGLVVGRSEDRLTANGREQMTKIRQTLKNYAPFLAVYASPMERCVESVQLVAPEYDPIYDGRLAERELGDLRNYRIDELWQNPLWNSLEVERTSAGAETLLAGLLRTQDFLNDLKAKYPTGGTVLLVTHSFISRCLWILTENITDPAQMSDFLHPNSEIRQYKYNIV
ncbi:histidine phosphatase family protein [Candidatus Saccharibacteria bacterium]|nr:histidine phosphatase family protein [Candidatus Saccharibacteria bacterium]